MAALENGNNNVNNNINDDEFDYSRRSQWLRAAVLGANDGLVTVTSLMMGVGAIREDMKAMVLAGFAGLVAGACSMAIGEYVSVHTQLDIELAHLKRSSVLAHVHDHDHDQDKKDDQEQLPSPWQAALASAIAFSTGAVVPLLAALFISDHRVRLVVVVAVASLALMVFGVGGAVLGRTPVVKSCGRVLLGGWVAIAITFGFTKLISKTGLEM